MHCPYLKSQLSHHRIFHWSDNLLWKKRRLYFVLYSVYLPILYYLAFNSYSKTLCNTEVKLIVTQMSVSLFFPILKKGSTFILQSLDSTHKLGDSLKTQIKGTVVSCTNSFNSEIRDYSDPLILPQMAT